MSRKKGLRGSVRQQGNGRWQVRYIDPHGKQRGGGAFPTRREAFDRLTSINAAINEDRWEDPAASTVTDPIDIDRMADAWFRRRMIDATDCEVGLREATVKEERRIYDLYIRDAFGKTSVVDVTHHFVEAWMNNLRLTRVNSSSKKDGRSLSTVSKPLSLLKRMLDQAVIVEQIDKNPAALVKLPRRESKETMRCLSVDQVEAVAEALTAMVPVWSERHAALPGRKAAPRAFNPALMVRLTVYGGAMRSGEMRALRVSDFDSATNRLTISKSMGRGGEGPPKTKAGNRVADLDDATALLVAAHVDGRDADDFMFCSPEGARVDGNSILKYWFRPALTVCGLDEATRWHDLRHTGISIMLAHGVPVTDVAAWAGHADPSITLSVYAHVLPDRRSSVADALNAMWAGIVTPIGKAS